MPQFNQSSSPTIKMTGSAGGPNHDTISIWSSIVTPTSGTGNGYAIDITEAGFTTITNIQLTPANNTASLTSVPLLSLKSYTNTTVYVNVLNINSIATVLVSATTGLVFATSLVGYSIHIRVEGY